MRSKSARSAGFLLTGLLTLMMLGAASAAHAEDMIIHAGTLLDGTSEHPRTRVSIVIRGERIVEVRDGFVAAGGVKVVDLSNAVVLPGLIDVHTHITWNERGGSLSANRWKQTALDVVLSAVPSARKVLEAGFTSIRNVGASDGGDLALKKAIERGDIAGPRMWVSLEPLGPTGGHSDQSNGLDPSLSSTRWENSVVDGVDDVIRQVRAHRKRGADLIKIMPSGGVTTTGDNPNQQLLSNDEIKAAIDTAHALGMKVAAHATGKTAIDNSLKLGVDSIEHGTLADEASYQLFKSRGVYLVPTLLVGARMMAEVRQSPEKFPPDVVQKTLRIGPVAVRNLSAAYRAGVKIAYGTDILWGHGENAQQFALMVGAGMPPIAAILAATHNAAELIGSADIGSIAPGRYADIIAVERDPLADIRALEDVQFVMKGGVIYKSSQQISPPPRVAGE